MIAAFCHSLKYIGGWNPIFSGIHSCTTTMIVERVAIFFHWVYMVTVKVAKLAICILVVVVFVRPLFYIWAVNSIFSCQSQFQAKWFGHFFLIRKSWIYPLNLFISRCNLKWKNRYSKTKNGPKINIILMVWWWWKNWSTRQQMEETNALNRYL